MPLETLVKEFIDYDNVSLPIENYPLHVLIGYVLNHPFTISTSRISFLFAEWI
ncbi:hypothetical protein AVDCRST_MAG81-2713 [uncultured Synechococcales cyanobacterium]|uniref:Uncharacterized protein n=1 Tax=uncultured Synechococcales cyanobacterium TaxID=1936017 RepID=A0A6J4VJC7_9CYAN|nr:hypothetical protein AVDCRST_MAG81-2713 [uncultured Synechococcales cyanobacterium]